MSPTIILGTGIAILMFAFIAVTFVSWAWSGIVNAISKIASALSVNRREPKINRGATRSHPKVNKNITRLHPQKQTEFATHPPLEFAAWRECPYCNVYDAHGILREPIRKSVRRMVRDDFPGGGRTFWYEKMRDHDAASIIRKCNKCSHIWGEK